MTVYTYVGGRRGSRQALLWPRVVEAMRAGKHVHLVGRAGARYCNRGCAGHQPLYPGERHPSR